ncbi:fluoride efflux transporter CrcB [Actinomadura citrea]|uniref:fluoride efflux transporter CrcB n=1 Tax=Actinomadura citrea TaxID=46158 RepID=UPI002E2D29C6|nr:fluoride efflux transporter CrcB [Actinomadura citrea]
MIALLVLIGGACGAVLRFVLDTLVKNRFGKAFPWGTLTVNLLGTGILGALHGVTASAEPDALVGTGFCGALTTFSTFELDTVHLFQEGKYARGAVNVIVSLGVGIGVFTLLYALFQKV